MVQPPVIVLPGITATSLEDYYTIPPEKVWSALPPRRYERISLHPDDVRYEVIEPARVRPRTLFGLIYEDLIEALRADLTKEGEQPTPVFGFTYDWRQDCTRSADQLREFINEVLGRASLLRKYRKKRLRVDLVGHSMGGLIIADYLNRYGKDRKVRRVVSIGTPFEGSIDAVLKLVTGMGTLTGESPRDRERKSARTIPAVYQLLPTYPGAVEVLRSLHNSLFDSQFAPERDLRTVLFNVKAWQPSILRSLKEFIKLHDAEKSSSKLLGDHLQMARNHRRSVRELSLNEALPEKEDGWLAIVGVNAPTQVQLRIQGKKNDPQFKFGEDVNRWKKRKPDTGDGTVPFHGACPAFLNIRRLVCVTPKDFSRWELKDRTLAKLAGFHAALPTINLVQRLAIRFLRDDFRGDVWGWKPPGVAHPAWPPWLKEKKK